MPEGPHSLSPGRANTLLNHWCFAGGSSGSDTGINGNLSADRFRNATGFRHNNLTWNTLGFGDHTCFTNLSWHTVWHFASAAFFHIAACCVRNLTGPCFTDIAASGVRNLLGHALINIAAGCVRNLLGAAFTNHAAGGVRNSTSPGFANIAASGVRNPFHGGHWNPNTSGVRNFADAGFWNHTCAGLCCHDRLGAPDLFADSTWWTLDFFHPAATWLINHAAGVRIENKPAWVLNTTFYNRTRNAFCHGFPFTALNRNRSGF